MGFSNEDKEEKKDIPEEDMYKEAIRMIMCKYVVNFADLTYENNEFVKVHNCLY